MNNRILSRWISAGLMVLVLAGAMYLDQVRRGQMGQGEYLAKAAIRYDRFYANPSLPHDIVGALLVGGMFLAIYEIVGYGTLVFLDTIRPEKRT
jgi:hypothetical protein